MPPSPRRSLPTLDIRDFHAKRELFLENLRRACHEEGFFLLRHDLPLDLPRRELETTRSFFALPDEAKQIISYDKSPSFRGYMKLGTENTAGETDWREQVEIGTEYTQSESRVWPPYERLKGTNQWPSEPPGLKDTSLEFVGRVLKIAQKLRHALCLAVGLPVSHQEDLFCDPHWFLKLIYYPPIPVDTQTMGVGSHTDTNFLTLVLQDDIGGLQVYHKQQGWIDVPTESNEDVLVCNLGEQAQIWSKGYFRATPHRVLPNHNSRPRISCPVFFNPSLDAVVRPWSVEHLEWSREETNNFWKEDSNHQMLASVGENTFKSLSRSHPAVFRKFHGDLELTKEGRIRRKK